jgi:dTDP-4-amino-4,6-dideoxygalactose transaminase
MLSLKEINKTISAGKPYPSKINWYAEPNLGSFFGKREIDSVINSLKKSNHWSIGFGPNAKEVDDFEKDFSKKFKVKHSVAVSNNGVGFDMLLSILNLKKSEEVIVPAINFKAWQMSILQKKIKTVFCDINYPDLSIDVFDLEKKINKNTRVVCPVHFSGASCQIDEIERIIKKAQKKFNHKIYIIYDAARAVGAKYLSNNIASAGDATIYSFNGQKIITTIGEGGMITTNNSILAKKLKDARSYGGEKNWGLNYRLPKISAVFGIEQLKRLDKIIFLRKKILKQRNLFFSKINDLILPSTKNCIEGSCYLYNIILKKPWSKKYRDLLIKYISEKYNIHYTYPKFINYRWPIIKKKYRIPRLLKSKFVYDNSITLPIHPSLNNKQELYICSTFLKSFFKIKNKFNL